MGVSDAENSHNVSKKRDENNDNFSMFPEGR